MKNETRWKKQRERKQLVLTLRGLVLNNKIAIANIRMILNTVIKPRYPCICTAPKEWNSAQSCQMFRLLFT